MRFSQREDSQDTPKTYVTATDARTKKAKCATIHGVTPEQLLQKLKDMADAEQNKRRPASAAA